jgi:flavodoxin
MKKLIAYYSRAGNNYVHGDIVDLPVGNTEIAANMVQMLTGSDIFRIDTIREYPADYHETTDVAKMELRRNARSELSGCLDNMADYGVIYLGRPDWWETMPMAVFTSLEAYNFSAKTIIPFCTHEGSAMGRSEADIRELCPDAKVLKGLPIIGGSVHGAKNNIADWLKKLGGIE